MNSSPAKDAQAENAVKRQFCSFRAANRLYGADILTVKEVTGETSFTAVHHAAPEVQGLVNIRGQISLVLDLRMLLGFDKQPISPNSRVVLFKPDVGESFGFLVDSVGDVISADENMIEWRKDGRKSSEAAETSGKHERLELGVCKLEKDLLVILNPAQALASLHSSSKIH